MITPFHPWNSARPEDKGSVDAIPRKDEPPSKAIVMIVRGAQNRIRVGTLIGTREVSVVLSKSAARTLAQRILDFAKED